MNLLPKSKGRFILPLVVFLFSVTLSAQEVPQLSKYVTDLTGTLSETEKNQLESKLADLEKTKGSQLVVVIVPTTGEYAIEQYSIKIFDEAKIGRNKVNDGVLLLVAKDDRRLRIEVGYGLEGAIPDVRAKRIIDDFIVPQFKAGNFYQGIDAGVDALITLINGEALPEVEPKADSTPSGSSSGGWGTLAMIAAFLLFIFGGKFLRSITNKWAAWGIMAPFAFFAGYLFLGTIAGGIIIMVMFLFFFNPFTGGGSGGGGYYSGYSGGYSSGGYSSGGWSSGGGGFSGGGFSGGGGSSGGGGASGGW